MKSLDLKGEGSYYFFFLLNKWKNWIVLCSYKDTSALSTFDLWLLVSYNLTYFLVFVLWSHGLYVLFCYFFSLSLEILLCNTICSKDKNLSSRALCCDRSWPHRQKPPSSAENWGAVAHLVHNIDALFVHTQSTVVLPPYSAFVDDLRIANKEHVVASSVRERERTSASTMTTATKKQIRIVPA